MGSIQYIPQQGFPAYYYPYTNQKGYLAPFVAVKFNGLKSKFNPWINNILKKIF